MVLKKVECVRMTEHVEHRNIACIAAFIVRPLSTVGYTNVAASVIHSRQWSN